MTRNLFLTCFFAFATVLSVHAQTTAFTYQGELMDGASAASGTYGMQFQLFTAMTGGSQQGSTITDNAVTVTNGVFTVQLDFAATPFAAGSTRWLQIGVRKASDPPGFTMLSPRQPLLSSPYSIRTLSAASADALSIACVGCVTDAKIAAVSGSKITGEVANAANATTAGNVTGTVAIGNGGTGSTTQNFVDLTTNQTIAGNKTFTGLLSGDGTGLTNVVRIAAISGAIPNLQSNGNYQFAGNPSPFFLAAAGQRLTGSIVAGLGSTSGSTTVEFGLCYQTSAPGSPLASFAFPSGDNSHVLVDAVRRPVPASATTVISVAGTYRAGFCVKNSDTLNNNDNVNGWLMVTNN